MKKIKLIIFLFLVSVIFIMTYPLKTPPTELDPGNKLFFQSLEKDIFNYVREFNEIPQKMEDLSKLGLSGEYLRDLKNLVVFECRENEFIISLNDSGKISKHKFKLKLRTD